MISKFTLYMGLNDQDSKRQEISTIEEYKIASNMLAATFGGGTIFEAEGIYKHDDGSIVIEKTLRIEILFAELPAVRYDGSLSQGWRINRDRNIFLSEISRHGLGRDRYPARLKAIK